MKNYKDIDEYLANFSGDTKNKLEQIRKTVHEVVPDAQEKISYGIPTFTYHGNLLHFAGYKTHIGFYPGSGPVKEFAKELSVYETAKGTIRLPLNKPLPVDLIRKITKSCAKRNESKKSS